MKPSSQVMILDDDDGVARLWLRAIGHPAPSMITAATVAQESRERAFAPGAAEYFSKPFEISQFSAAVRRILNSRGDARRP